MSTKNLVSLVIFFQHEGILKRFPDKQKLGEFLDSKTNYQIKIKEALQAESK